MLQAPELALERCMIRCSWQTATRHDGPYIYAVHEARLELVFPLG